MAANDMNAGQTITACGKLRSLSVDIKKYGSPVLNIRAKIYLTEPVQNDSGFPLGDYLGQSTNVIAASSLTGVFSTQTFYFNNLDVTGKWTVMFEYETVVDHDEFNYLNFAIGFPANPGEDLYSGGDFVYYVYDSDIWFVFTYGDMVFNCTYCYEECPTTTTTTINLGCTLWQLRNNDQTLIVWSYLECGEREESYVYQEADGPDIYVCSLTEPVPSGNGHVTNTEEPCFSTPTTTTTTNEFPI